MAHPLSVGLDARHAKRGLGISVFVRSLAAELERRDDVELHWLGGRGPYPLLDSVAMARRRLPHLDVVHFTGNTGWTRPGPVPFVLTVHDLIFTRSDTRWGRPRASAGHAYSRFVTPRAAAAAAAVAVPSAATAAEVKRLIPNGAPVHVIPNGVAAPPFPGQAGTGDYVIAFSGSDPRKGVDLVLDAFSRVRGVDRLVLVAGAGLPAGFQELAKAKGVAERVDVRPRVDDAERWQLLGGARALLYPSREEGFGLPVLEAMAVGVPVVTGLSPATRELGAHAVLAIDQAEPAASMAEAVARIVADPALAAELAERGRARAAEFTWTRAADAYVQLYREAVR